MRAGAKFQVAAMRRAVTTWLRRRRRAARIIRRALDDDERPDMVGDADCGPGAERSGSETA
jgi:hypothetical protein